MVSCTAWNSSGEKEEHALIICFGRVSEPPKLGIVIDIYGLNATSLMLITSLSNCAYLRFK